MSDDITATADAWNTGEAAAPPEPVASAPEGPALPFRFDGQAGEYFRIWIVNLCLSILTLGIYSAWAKVRTRRYFYGNTSLDGASFEYTAEPLQILKGRLIAASIIGAYVLVGQFFPLASLPLMVVYWLVFPWLLMKSLAFNAHYSMHRGLRFQFKQDAGEAIAIYALWPILIPLTLGLIFPLWKARIARFYTERHSFGRTPFTFHATAGGFYKIYLVAVLLGSLGLGALIVVMTQWGELISMLFMQVADVEVSPDGATDLSPWQIFVMQLTGFATAAAFYLFFLPAFAWVRAKSDNLRWNSTRIEGHGFRCDQSAMALFGIYLTNIIGILLTFGLAIPWAKVRLARYRAEHLALVPNGPIDDLLAGADEEVSAAADAFDDLGGFDAGL